MKCLVDEMPSRQDDKLIKYRLIKYPFMMVTWHYHMWTKCQVDKMPGRQNVK